MSFVYELNKKLVSADTAARVVKSGDWVEYSHFACVPRVMDEALARRRDELENVKIRACTSLIAPRVCQVDPEQKHFIYNSWHMSGAERKLHDQGLCTYIPFFFGECPDIYYRYLEPDVAIMQVTPMDKHGAFNFSAACSYSKAVCDKSRVVILEVNDRMPVCLGGNHESVHISEVDYVVEGLSEPLLELPNPKINEEDKKIAALIMEELEDGACLQLGIGGIPNSVGAMIAESDLKDLGVHTEILAESFVDMYEAGRITGACKNIDRYKMVYTFAMGTSRLYEFLDNNTSCAIYPVNYSNNPMIICRNDKVMAINSALEIDLYGQVASESVGTRHISGTGGQMDYILGAWYSRGGKGFICLTSTYTDHLGKVHSRIKPTLDPGTIVSCHRCAINYVVTEYGIAQLKGLSNWERAEALINIAHPSFRDELVAAAKKMGIWNPTNKLP